MSQSVSFILPVRDLQHGLRQRAHLVLEVLEELTTDFDVLIVDYGSRDETCEIALDLVREYPQIDFLDLRQTVDIVAAIEAGIQRTRGDIVFIHDPTLPLSLTALRSLWKLRDDDDLVMAQSRSSSSANRPLVSVRSGQRLANPIRSSIQMIRRCAMRDLHQPETSTPVTVDRVTRTDLMDEPAEPIRLPKLLSRLRRLSNA